MLHKIILALAFTLGLSTSAFSKDILIGVTMAKFDDNFLTVLRNGMEDYVGDLGGVQLQVEDGQNDMALQIDQINNFISSGVDAIISNPVDTDATVAMTQAAEAAGIPLVYVNREPINVDSLPSSQAFVGSDEVDSGTQETKAVCQLLKDMGKGDSAEVVILVGGLSHMAARVRTQDVHDVVATPECSFMKVVEEQTANWSRDEANDLMTNWISGGIEFDAVIANNDEMAIGAIQALKSAGISMEEMIVAGIDATQDALSAMAAGDLDVTVFQNAAAQGAGAVDAALTIAKGGSVERVIYIPFEPVLPENLSDYLDRN
tara:strand:+ start:5379 stop:6332 length:954 start_codon:yes stop_codon:yes gene_type:complete